MNNKSILALLSFLSLCHVDTDQVWRQRYRSQKANFCTWLTKSTLFARCNVSHQLTSSTLQGNLHLSEESMNVLRYKAIDTEFSEKTPSALIATVDRMMEATILFSDVKLAVGQSSVTFWYSIGFFLTAITSPLQIRLWWPARGIGFSVLPSIHMHQFPLGRANKEYGYADYWRGATHSTFPFSMVTHPLKVMHASLQIPFVRELLLQHTCPPAVWVLVWSISDLVSKCKCKAAACCLPEWAGWVWLFLLFVILQRAASSAAQHISKHDVIHSVVNFQ